MHTEANFIGILQSEKLILFLHFLLDSIQCIIKI